MKTKLFKSITLSVIVIGLGGCNLGPLKHSENSKEFVQDISALKQRADPPDCYGLRYYYRWICEDGEWTLEWAGRRDILCSGHVWMQGDKTQCYADFATYNCETQLACGSYHFVCPTMPPQLCRPVFDPPDEFAR